MEKPVLFFDGDCGFCRRWIYRWRSWVGERVEFIPFQSASERFPAVSVDASRASVQLIARDGSQYRGAEAVFRVLAENPSKRWMLGLYRAFPPFKAVSDWFYALVASHRIFFSRITRWLWGNHLAPPTYQISAHLFLRGLGFIYPVAFASFWSQMPGLIGPAGILPVRTYLEAIQEAIPTVERFWRVPTLFWFSSAPVFLHMVCAFGVLLSIVLIAGLIPWFSLLLLWFLYLSLVHAGQVFTSFQWDILLLETGFLSLFLCPWVGWLKTSSFRNLPRLSSWLFQWLLFRLMWRSGLVKLASGDKAWGNLEAMKYHYETQPLPTWIGWYAHHLPEWLQRYSTVGMFVIELVLPFLIFAPRRLRLLACGGFVLLQLMILITGNYCFFNLLTLLLCLFLMDDASWFRGKRLHKEGESPKPAGCWYIPGWMRACFFVLVMAVSMLQMARLGGHAEKFPFLRAFEKTQAPFYLVNPYGLFAVMTTQRPEIIVEGSLNGLEWTPYDFRWKPDELGERPRFVAPHQPRLDWQMWFAALGDFRQNPWFVRFMVALIENRPPVTALLNENPFEKEPPRYIRAVLYRYEFTTPEERAESGLWWRRRRVRLYTPVVTREGGRAVFLAPD